MVASGHRSVAVWLERFGLGTAPGQQHRTRPISCMASETSSVSSPSRTRSPSIPSRVARQGGWRPRCRHAGVGNQGEADGDFRPASCPLAGDGHGAAMKLGELFHQREADAESRMPATRTFVLLTEHLEDMREEDSLYPFTGIAYVYYAGVSIVPNRHFDAATSRGEFDSVGEDVRQDLLKPICVCVDWQRLVHRRQQHLEPLLLRCLDQGLHRDTDFAAQVSRLEIEGDASPRRTGKLEKVVDQPRLELGISLDHLHRPLDDGRITVAIDQAGPQQNGGEGGSQLLARYRREPLLGGTRLRPAG